MRIVYTDHLRARLKEREIPLKIVKEIFDKAEEYYLDKLRGHNIVVSTVKYQGKLRKALLAYDTISEEEVEAITVHPITSEQIKQRVSSGRWIHEKTQS